MARISLFQSVALAAFATVLAVPAQAQDATVDAQVVLAAASDQDRGNGGGGWRSRDPGASGVQPAPERSYRAETRGQGGEQRAEARAERQQRRAERIQAPQQAAPQQRNAPEGGWRSQRAGEGQRYGRNWDNGTVSRPAPAWRGATPQVPERGSGERTRTYRGGTSDGQWATQRNRTYSDPGRTGIYRGDRDRSSEIGRDRQGDRTIYRNGYRDGRTADTYRDRRDQNYAYRNGYNSASRDSRRWDHSDWRRDTRYNWSGYRSQHRDLYRAGRYYSPYSNYRYNRLSIGIFLDSGFYGNRYWVNDPWQYRLPEVYGPYRWVRYYDDVLLVDIYTGEVVDVIHDFFW